MLTNGLQRLFLILSKTRSVCASKVAGYRSKQKFHRLNLPQQNAVMRCQIEFGLPEFWTDGNVGLTPLDNNDNIGQH